MRKFDFMVETRDNKIVVVKRSVEFRLQAPYGNL